LSRFLAIGAEAEADWVVRVTADNPFLDANLINLLLDGRDGNEEAKRADAIRIRSRLPLGYGAELVRLSALERAATEIPSDQFHHRVHVTSWLSTGGRAPGQSKPIRRLDLSTPDDWPDRPDWRWTVDTYEDLAMARSAFRVFGLAAANIDYPAMVALLDRHPEISSMNQHINQKELEEG
jgi:spore coat polysaccharide biosynthesis protein SpsF (cytidylyltransferase family)